MSKAECGQTFFKATFFQIFAQSVSIRPRSVTTTTILDWKLRGASWRKLQRKINEALFFLCGCSCFSYFFLGYYSSTLLDILISFWRKETSSKHSSWQALEWLHYVYCDHSISAMVFYQNFFVQLISNTSSYDGFFSKCARDGAANQFFRNASKFVVIFGIWKMETHETNCWCDV